uniref:Osteocalcin n=1 Tax=Melopsittacus undulatus TaxID=13146 RepID=A0A8V5GP10_MELUD
MRLLLLLPLLALLGWGGGGGCPYPAPPDPCSVPAAFVSKRASAEMRRHKRNYVYDSGAYGAVRDPLEAKREVCEFNPACDELADHIGFQEAFRRYYVSIRPLPILPSVIHPSIHPHPSQPHRSTGQGLQTSWPLLSYPRW